VLVQAAGSGVSVAAIQIARLLGARVIVTSGSDEKCRRALELGADAAINYATQDVVAEVRTLTGRRGVDVVVDHVGEATWDGSIKSLARGGRLVTCGATTGPKAAIDLRVLFFKGLSLLGSTMGSKGELHQILPLVFAGKLRPVVAEVLPLRDVARGHELLESRSVFGKIVLEVSPS
jgi:NADPH:quinone reductase-like Zn-dependent oxidoreductase